MPRADDLADWQNGKMSHIRPNVLAAGLAAIAVVVAACSTVGGTASLTGVSTPPVVTTSSSPAANSAAASSSVAASSSSSAALSSSVGSSAATTRAGAVPGIPHSTPMPDNILITDRRVDDEVDLYQIDTTTGAVGDKMTKGVIGGQYPIISPDRGSVIYLQISDKNELRVMAADGSGDRTLLPAGADFCNSPLRPAWNPIDTTEIAVSCRTEDGGYQLNLMGVDGALHSTLHPGLATFDDPSYSPDGKTLVFWGSQEKDVGGGALYLMPVNGSSSPQQITSPGRAEDVDPVWSVDGTKIYFRRAATDAGGNSTAQIIEINADGTGLRPITDGTAFDQDPTLSPDGTQIAFRSNRIDAAGIAEPQVWVTNLDGTDLRQMGLGTRGTAEGAPEWGRR